MLQKTDNLAVTRLFPSVLLMKALSNYLIILFSILMSLNAMADCPQFETALETAMRRVMARETLKKESKVEPTLKKAADWARPEAQNYKIKYGANNAADGSNRTFIKLMEADKTSLTPSKTVYFDVENSVQKKLNDTLIGDKAMVDAINNSFMEKFNKNLKDSPVLFSRVEGQYKDYKATRLRLTLLPNENRAEFEAQLAAVYEKTNREFVAEFEKNGLTKLLPPRTDEVPDVSTWFLSGSGESALEANMAARGARSAGFSTGNAKTVNFKQQIESMHLDVMSIEGIRKTLAADRALASSKIMTTTAEGAVIPSKDMIGILRKTNPSDCENAIEYAAKIRAKVKTLFNTDISDKHIDELTTYFQKVDSISPPLFQRERVAINLGDAKNGIVSVDFTGVGVDNAFEQMRALSTVNYGQIDKTKLLKDAFSKVQTNVDGVTADINSAKRFFSVAAVKPKDIAITKFSGDDGILMPKINWERSDKVDLIKRLSKTEDPSKYRVTFTSTEYYTGGTVPAAQRSQRVVRSEAIEKTLREAVVGVGSGKISSEKAKKMIFAIDSTPSVKGGKINLILGGTNLTEDEKKFVAEAFSRALLLREGEKKGDIIEAFN